MRGTCKVFVIIFGITNLKVYIGQRVKYDLREEKLRLCNFHSVSFPQETLFLLYSILNAILLLMPRFTDSNL